MHLKAIHVYICLGFVESRLVYTKSELSTYPIPASQPSDVESHIEVLLSKESDYSLKQLWITKNGHLKNLPTVDGTVNNLSSLDVSREKGEGLLGNPTEIASSNKRKSFSAIQSIIDNYDVVDESKEATYNSPKTKTEKRADPGLIPKSRRKPKKKSSKLLKRETKSGIRRRLPGRQARAGLPNRGGQRGQRVNNLNAKNSKLRNQRQGTLRKFSRAKSTKKITPTSKAKTTRKQKQLDTQDTDRSLKTIPQEKDLPIKDGIPAVAKKKNVAAPVAGAKDNDNISTDTKSPDKGDKTIEKSLASKNGVKSAVVGGAIPAPGKKDVDADPIDPAISKNGKNPTDKDTVGKGVAGGAIVGGAAAGGAALAGGALTGNALTGNGVAPGGSTPGSTAPGSTAPVPGTKDVDPNSATGKKDDNESVNTNPQRGANNLDDDDDIPTGPNNGRNRGQNSGGFDDDFPNQGGFQGNNGG
ncbi:hypothetical protein BGT96224_A20944, partial [Blumeria graminis f. sp. tritici 96224]